MSIIMEPLGYDESLGMVIYELVDGNKNVIFTGSQIKCTDYISKINM